MVKGAVTGTLRDVDTSGALKRSFDAQQDAAKKAFDAQKPTKDAADAFRKQQEADKKAWDAQKAARRMGELDGDHGITADPKKLVPANQGLTPNETIVDPATGAVDLTRSRWSRSTWSRSRWSQATGDLSPGGLARAGAAPARGPRAEPSTRRARAGAAAAGRRSLGL